MNQITCELNPCSILDPHAAFKDHITNKSKIAFYSLSLICKIMKFLESDQLQVLVCSLIFLP